MKTLVLVRHAKSSWKYDLPDKERPLKSRGLNDAELVSKHFKNKGFTPDMVYSSPANRALTTCNIFIKNLKVTNNLLKIDNKLYDFGGQSVTNFIKNLDDDLQNVVIFGHNHAFTSVVNKFGSEYIENVPTCGLVKIDFDVDKWSDIQKGKTSYVLIPKDLKG